MRASQFINEAMDSDAVNELDSFLMNDEDLYRRRFMPIISNIKRTICDFIAGMTDRYAINLYKNIK